MKLDHIFLHFYSTKCIHLSSVLKGELIEVMSLESALVGPEDYRSENKNNLVMWSQNI